MTIQNPGMPWIIYEPKGKEMNENYKPEATVEETIEQTLPWSEPKATKREEEAFFAKDEAPATEAKEPVIM